MHFAPDTEVLLAFNVALANTVASASRSGADELATTEQLFALVGEHGFTGRFDRDAAELAEVRAARAELRRIWVLDRDAMAGEVNALLRDTQTLPQLARHDGFDWHLHATGADAPLADRILAEAAIALVDVIRATATGRLRLCEADDCEGLFADLSRNGSRRYCSVRCGNRMNMVAHRRRQSGE
ncbi:putative RNA-binding Zn ribbon-like protein [Marisediminicola sp. UYEF4]|uniref:CGNR zinc finger domain-containing protein n=1 Tax=Marisediminicola sp. UYEF4 TaxID=1756384 RepID=UPI003391549E